MYRNPQQTAQDMHFAVGDTGLKLIFGSILAVGLVAWIGYMMTTMDANRSATSPTTEGTLIEINAGGMVLPFVGGVTCPSAKYSYIIDNKSYSGQTNCGPCWSLIRRLTWHPPELDLPDEQQMTKDIEEDEKKALLLGPGAAENFKARFKERMQKTEELLTHPKFKPVKVRFEQGHPENSVLDPNVLQADKSQMYTSLFLVLVGGVLLGGTFLHSYMASAPGDDPTLSLEGALAAQKRRGRR